MSFKQAFRRVRAGCLKSSTLRGFYLSWYRADVMFDLSHTQSLSIAELHVAVLILHLKTYRGWDDEHLAALEQELLADWAQAARRKDRPS
ncbi:MAG: hypothetical protein VXW65_06585 [Pseudomonadota bacterium]|nr:hypothetical protein [Pseudomonadota bacterium]